MRFAMCIVAGLTVLCILLGLWFLSSAATGGSGISPLPAYGIGCIGLSLYVAGVTAILGIVASARRRQFAWLVAIILVTLIPLIGIPTVNILAGQVDPDTSQVLTGPVFAAFILGGPMGVALVVVLYSFRLRTPATVGAPPRATAPLP